MIATYFFVYQQKCSNLALNYEDFCSCTSL